MATTPRPYLWQSLQERASSVEGVGGIAHYFTEEAQSFYLKNGIAQTELDIEKGHWQELVPEAESLVSDDTFSQLSWHHPSMGTLYGTAILPGDDDATILYLLRYEYAKDIGHLIQNGKYSMQVDNPITQFNGDIKNYDSSAFTKPTTLYQIGARLELGLTMGDSAVYGLARMTVDEVDFQYNKPTVGISGRNQVGAILNDETFNIKDTKTDTIHNVCAYVLDYFGIENYVIDANANNIKVEINPSDTGLKVLQDICDKASGYENGSDWDIEETYDGTIIIGYNSFRSQYLKKSVYAFDGRASLFKRSSQRAVDGAYSKVYVTGKDSNNNDLEPVIEPVETWNYWAIGANKTYFAQMDKTTPAELARYAKVLAKQLKKTGLNESYTTTIRPQLLVGDYAVVDENGEETDIGIITQVTHNMGEKGFTTDFVADSGGDKQTLITRSVGAAAANEQVYTSTRRNNGDNRKKRLMDFIKGTAQQVVRSSGGGGGGSQVSGVQDVTVDGVSVVEDNTAKIILTGKQDVLTAGDRISIDNDTISANIAPFSIVDGKMCMTYKGEDE